MKSKKLKLWDQNKTGIRERKRSGEERRRQKLGLLIKPCRTRGRGIMKIILF